MNFKEIGIRSLFALLGVAILALGTAVLRIGDVGIDPFTSANLATANLLGLSLGVYQLALNFIIFIFVILFGRKYIGAGTVINMVLTGFFIDFFIPILKSFGLGATDLFQQLLYLVIGLLLFSFGASFYMSAGVGQAPYDAVAPMIVDRTKLSYRVARVAQDASFLTLAFILKGPIGIATFATAFTMGPFIQFWNEKISKPIITHSVEIFFKKNDK